MRMQHDCCLATQSFEYSKQIIQVSAAQLLLNNSAAVSRDYR